MTKPTVLRRNHSIDVESAHDVRSSHDAGSTPKSPQVEELLEDEIEVDAVEEPEYDDE